ncbi:MAG TPA: DNA internalization-related competence protein ComEC/Rec2, partial [Alcanivorax sp.]|nr:DNA internalization-related competence protein ComEC/Rec2 [Alcanivorax sp.]
PDPGAPPPGRVDLVVFEVGQGQALALRTAGHLVLYDAGPGWNGGSAMARVVVPWLRRHGLRPDVTVISHGDGDHAGGLEDLPWPGRLLAGEPDRVPGAAPCRAGQHWRFDGVDFRVLWPRDRDWQGNDASCVLRVDAVGASLLLTGDITKAVEYRLLGKVAPVDVLQLAHHGSASSSADAWVASLAPRWAVASVGYANRFRHPAPDLVAGLEAAGVTVLRTDRTGMIVFRLGGLDNAALVEKWRRDHGRPWHRPVGGRSW